MGVTLYNLKKWYRMLIGKSIFHVNQGEGTCYSKTEVKGYYNDLTEKVLKDKPDIKVPKYNIEKAGEIYFSIGVFQYGLASYDLYLKTGEQVYKDKMIACADWAIENQQENGGWETFAFLNKQQPYSAMAQGEGISMLIRAHIVTKDQKYLTSATKAKNLMIKPISDGGTTKYVGDDVYLYEYTFTEIVLNGWIFSLWGMYDYFKYLHDEGAGEFLNKTLQTLKKKLPEFDLKYWSRYDDGKNICSPFYQRLHVAQLRVMYDLFGDSIYKEFADKWDGYQKSFWKRVKAFIIKVCQKVF